MVHRGEGVRGDRGDTQKGVGKVKGYERNQRSTKGMGETDSC